jgi:hypothetical protein
VLLFGGFVAQALRLRANREAHKRLMLFAHGFRRMARSDIGHS